MHIYILFTALFSETYARRTFRGEIRKENESLVFRDHSSKCDIFENISLVSNTKKEIKWNFPVSFRQTIALKMSWI